MVKTKPCTRCGGTGQELADPAATLREARTTAGLTQAEVAERLGMSTAHISDIERGNRKASPALVAQWVEACGTTKLSPT